MSKPVIELVQLSNGDIVLRSSDTPEQPLVTITFSDLIDNLLPADKLDVSRSMVEAGIQRYQEIQFQNIEDSEDAVASGFLH